MAASWIEMQAIAMTNQNGVPAAYCWDKQSA
jgi:hypothetical protein